MEAFVGALMDTVQDRITNSTLTRQQASEILEIVELMVDALDGLNAEEEEDISDQEQEEEGEPAQGGGPDALDVIRNAETQQAKDYLNIRFSRGEKSGPSQKKHGFTAPRCIVG